MFCRQLLRPSDKNSAFITGAGSVLDLSGQSSGRLKFGDASTDMIALHSDWFTVGNDMKQACIIVTGKADNKKSKKNGTAPN